MLNFPKSTLGDTLDVIEGLLPNFTTSLEDITRVQESSILEKLEILHESNNGDQGAPTRERVGKFLQHFELKVQAAKKTIAKEEAIAKEKERSSGAGGAETNVESQKRKHSRNEGGGGEGGSNVKKSRAGGTH